MRLIDADALIDRIKNPYEQAQVARWVNEQPTIEPEKRTEECTETHACDLIDREAAVDAIYHHLPSVSRMEARLMLHEVPSAQAERKKPVFKTGESVYHVSYADGTGGFEKNKWADWTCPDCGWFVGEQYIPRRHNQQKCNYCARCGCAINWSDADMRGEQDE